MEEAKNEILLSSPDITSAEVENVLQVLKTPYLSQGPKIKEFEKKISEYIDMPYAIAVNSGTSALHLIVKSLGLKEGDEVITTPFSFIASSNCLLMEKVKPVFVDINPLTMNIDYNLIKEKITPKTKAILPVHIFGHPAEIEKIKKIADENNLAIIEDACEAIGAEINREKVGRRSSAAAFAFYPNKQITTGEGGIIVTSSKEIADLCVSMRNQGRSTDGDWLKYERPGYNYRMDEMSASLGVAQINRIEEILLKRKQIAEMYMKKLSGIKGITLPYTAENIERSWFVFPIKVDEKIRNRVIKMLKEEGIGCRAYFPCIHLEPFYKNNFGYKKGDFPIAEKMSRQTIAIPFYNNIKEEDMDHVVLKLKQILEKLENETE